MSEVGLVILAFVSGIAVGVVGMALAIHHATVDHLRGRLP